jgi:hypothetical protein
LSLNPVATDPEVGAFEAQHDIALPEDYRLFITTIGNGGPGPADYGILPLGAQPSDFRPEEVRYWSQLPDVRIPFPFTQLWIREDGSTSAEGTEAQINHGSIVLGTDGCGMYWHLIVSGPDRGIVWQLCGEGIQPVCPKRGFAQWYEDWLDGKDAFYGFEQANA